MLSRLALRAGALQSVAKAQVSPRSVLVLAARTNSTGKEEDHVANWEKANQIYYGNERDTKNFPHPVQADISPSTRLGFIPESWFKAFYDKTGVTGPYMFGAGLVTFLLSKEIWIVEHGFAEFVTFWIAVIIINRKYGTKIGEYFDKMDSDFISKKWDNPISESKANCQAVIDSLQSAISEQDGQKYLYEAKRENVDLQLEAIYRQRLADVHTQVKKKLDYQLETENAERRYQQTHMTNWIVDSVVKSISPQQEKDSIAKCIQDLKALAKRQPAMA